MYTLTANPISCYNREVKIPADKSITHRAVMFNAFSKGQAVVTNPLLGEDCLSTINCMRKLGAQIEVGSAVTIKGTRLNGADVLDVGNSGTTIRLLLGLLAGAGIPATLTGDESICRRPLSRVAIPLAQMGAKITTTAGCAPATVLPSSLSGIDYTLPVLSAQVKSAILLAGLNASGATTVRETVQTRNHTELLLGAMGADITVGEGMVTVRRSTLSACNVEVPADISSAAYFLVLGSALKQSKITMKGVGINPTRTGILDVLTAAGGNIAISNTRCVAGEMVGDITVESARLSPFTVSGNIIPRLIDEIPALCVLACMIEGESVIKNAEELKVKESDRIALIADSLVALGADITKTDDGMIIRGRGRLRGGAAINPQGDHRIAMSMFVAGLLSEKGCKVQNAGCADVSFPSFYSNFKEVL